jgi:crotonobetainyl-CoA:carnitine CoA-transferase CaiB-like acyl-CoA transferase
VIKIEPPFPRNAAPGPAALGMGGGRPTAGLGKLNRNKLSVGIDLRRPGGQWLLQRLAARADLLVENFSARVMPNFGLGYETLRQDNPGLIYLSMTGYGTFGPYREYLGYGSATEAMTGLTALIGYPGEEPLNSAIAYPDAVAGLTGASCALTALVQRAHTGQGQFIDLSQLEPSSLVLGEFFLAAQLDGHAPPRTGNHHPIWAPHGTYRCRGGDEWVSLAVRSDAEWAAFCRVAGLEALGQDSGLADAAGRRAQRERINAAISAWTRDQDKFAVMERLQRAGIPAGAVLNAKELVENPYLAHRGFFVDARAPEGGSFPMPGTPITVDGGKRDEWHAAPLRGEHNALVLTELLGMESREIDALTAAGVLVDGTPVGA